ncbi:MAG: hypothetical protein SVE93_07095, partial [Candidatus Thermoplasmatota archaeon]|nr:hypothetical protein [Candidatus Thermoplasmatota archaeon]
METKILGIVLAIALLLAPVAFIAPARAQEKRAVYASEVTIDGIVEKYKLPTLISMETGGTFVYNNTTYTIKPNDGAVYAADGTTQVGLVTQTKYYAIPEETDELDVTVDMYHVVEDSWDPWYYLGDEPTATINEETVALNFNVAKGEGSFEYDGTTYYYADKTIYSDEDHEDEVGEFTSIKGWAVHPDDEVYATVTLKGTEEPVGDATVRWVGDPQTTDVFGETGAFVAPFYDEIKKKGYVEATKEYGTNTTVKRSIYGRSEYRIYIVPFDLSQPGEFLAWWGQFALTEESQAMYEAAEVLGDWGANLSEDGVTVWSNIFGPKGGSLAEFIRSFPQFMVDRGAALEATQNMLDTIWAIFTLLPAFMLALPQLLQTAPMRMLQFWPVLFINLDLVLDGISQMVIDIGVFMTSLAPSVLLLLPDIFNRLPNIGPDAMNIVLTAFELFVQMIPALSQYLPAAIAAIPAFFMQMLMALFYNAPAIFSTVMDETFLTLKNLFRSWPLFPAGIAAGLLAVAPALMMLPSMAPLVLLGRTLENTAGALGDWMQSMREAPSVLLDPILHALGTNPATLFLRYLEVCAYCWGTSICCFWPAIGIAGIALCTSMQPLILLAIALALAPFFALLMFVPVFGWIWDAIWAGWMAASAIASCAVTVPGTIADMLSYVLMRGFQVCTIPGYAVGWCLQGVFDV